MVAVRVVGDLRQWPWRQGILRGARSSAWRVEGGVDCGIDGPTGAVAAVAFAAVLYKIVRSSAVQSALSSIIQSALHAI